MLNFEVLPAWIQPSFLDILPSNLNEDLPLMKVSDEFDFHKNPKGAISTIIHFVTPKHCVLLIFRNYLSSVNEALIQVTHFPSTYINRNLM